jgi:acetyl esterase/lipase
MSSRHMVDPELLAALDLIPAVDFSPEVIALMQSRILARTTEPFQPGPGLKVEAHAVPGREGHAVNALVVTPLAVSAARPAILYLHGGGYVIGSAAMVLPECERLALGADCIVVSLDYRLAPDTPHPGPVEDGYDALAWMHQNAETLGIDTTRIAIAGQSAGGGLAAALALLVRDRGEYTPIHQHLMWPMIDDRTCLVERPAHMGEFIWSPGANHYGWAALLGTEPGSAYVSPYAAAARAESVAGLPDTFISVGGLDLFVEEDLEYARRLMAVGVPVELHVFPGAYHGFDMVADAAVTKRSKEASLSAFRRVFARAEPAAQASERVACSAK